jgi:hypothetical protein
MRWVPALAIVLRLATTAPGADRPLLVHYVALTTRWPPPPRPASVHYRIDVEFTDDHLAALRDDEAEVRVTVRPRDGRPAHRRLEDLEDCRLRDDGSLDCPQGVTFHRLGDRPARWRLVVEFSQRGEGGARGPVVVQLAYSVSGGPRTVHTGTIRGCTPGRGGPAIVCDRARTAVAP